MTFNRSHVKQVRPNWGKLELDGTNAFFTSRLIPLGKQKMEGHSNSLSYYDLREAYVTCRRLAIESIDDPVKKRFDSYMKYIEVLRDIEEMLK